MKKLNIYLLLTAILFAVGCTPESAEIGPAPTEADVKFSFTPKADQPNVVFFTNETPNSTAVWNFGNSVTAKGDEVKAEYPVKGDYTVTLTVYTKSGAASSTQVVSIADNDYSFFEAEEFTFLTGGLQAIEGKTWVWDQTVSGHMGIGPADGSTPEWWAASPGQKGGLGVYDDEITFSLDGFSFDLENNGDTYAKDYVQAELEALGGVVTQSDDDITLDIDFDQANWTWTMTEKGGVGYLIFNGGAFPSWHTGGSQEYEIVTLNNDELYLRTIGGDGNAWYYGFIRKGFERPTAPDPEPEPEPEKELKAEDFYEDFEGNSNITWFTEEVEEFDVAFANPLVGGANTSATVAKYLRTGANEWANAQIHFDYKLDLSTRNFITLKVLIPEDNDYVTENGGAVGGPLLPRLSLKLQDSSHGAPWETQYEVYHELTEDQLGKWVVLSFDFSGAADRTDFDKIIVQFGGEGHFSAGTFYLDDIELQ
ncbi:PKD domain-containing protein [Sediminitomix flava]|uniref:PKD domain-containing protein n=1 Tax=Sediminitomix flava TaxID=379075 RepID=A0A315Z0G4_SEDFL|nr:PKD domain-containing protein [Sediminitomix flava]PWJ36157.1 hypothetical protein BC781_109176 [Sediminitomix flava]